MLELCTAVIFSLIKSKIISDSTVAVKLNSFSFPLVHPTSIHRLPVIKRIKMCFFLCSFYLSVESPTLAPSEFDDDEKEDFGLVEESLAGLPPVQEP